MLFCQQTKGTFSQSHYYLALYRFKAIEKDDLDFQYEKKFQILPTKHVTHTKLFNKKNVKSENVQKLISLFCLRFVLAQVIESRCWMTPMKNGGG